MRTGKVVLVMLAVLAMAGAAGAQIFAVTVDNGTGNIYQIDPAAATIAAVASNGNGFLSAGSTVVGRYHYSESYSDGNTISKVDLLGIDPNVIYNRNYDTSSGGSNNNLAASLDGTIYEMDRPTATLYTLQFSGNTVSRTFFATLPQAIDNYGDIAWGPNGNLWIATNDPQGNFVWDPDTDSLISFGDTGRYNGIAWFDGKLYGSLNGPGNTGLLYELSAADMSPIQPAIINNSFRLNDLSGWPLGEFCFQDETAWADGARYTQRGNWATYTPYPPLGTVKLYAGKDIEVGIVTFALVTGGVEITINLDDGWRFADLGEENLHIQPYYGLTGPSGNPAPGLFEYKQTLPSIFGLEYTTDPPLPQANFYGIHVVVEQEVECETETVCADFRSLSPGESVEGEGTVLDGLTISTPVYGPAVALFAEPADEALAIYGAPNSACGKTPIWNGGMDAYGGFGDLAAKIAGAAHAYTFTFDQTVLGFSLRMLDYGDYNKPKGSQFYAAMTAYGSTNIFVDQDVLDFWTQEATNPRNSAFGDLVCGAGDAVEAVALKGEPGNYTWHVNGYGIAKVELFFDPDQAYDPNIAFDTLCITRYVTD